MKKGILAGSILLVIIATVVTCFLISGRNSVESHLKLAVKYFNEGNYEEAVLEFDKAIVINDRVPEVFFAKASTELCLEREDDAAETTLNALKLMKDEVGETVSAVKVLDELSANSKYSGIDELVLWWYDKTYDDETYEEYRKWIEEKWGEKYKEEISKIQESHKPSEELYDSILTSYQKAENNNYEYDYINGEEFESLYPHVNAEIAMSGGMPKLYYIVEDLNDDGVAELAVASLGNEYNLYDIYTYDNGPKQLFDPYSMGYRVIYTIYEDGVIGCCGDGGISTGGYTFYKINKVPSESKYVSPIEYLEWEDYSGTKRYFITREGGDTNTEITKQEYDSAIAKYKKIEQFEWKELSGYVSRANSGKPTKAEATETNDVLTLEEAEMLVLDETKGEYSIMLDSEDNMQYVFRQFEDMPDHIATMNWYYVNKKTREVTSML